MVKTIVVLLFTIIVIPVVSFYFDDPITFQQKHILIHTLYITLIIALLCFAVGQITGNCSQVDKLWSILPVMYVWYITYAAGFNERMVLMAVLVTVWGGRLTYNFSRRGAYSWKFWTGEEDYRWEVLRNNSLFKGKKVRWFLFNLCFICLYQNALILLFTLPILVTLNAPDQHLTLPDYVLAGLFMVFVIIETVADQQQWNFHKEKKRLKESGQPLPADYDKGFITSGLWSKVRHPNYMSEQSIWIIFYFFSVVATGHWINWSMAGCLLLVILFQGSSDFSEAISSSKYPGYADYKKRVGRFIPKFWEPVS